jgi:hypothetical protein
MSKTTKKRKAEAELHKAEIDKLYALLNVYENDILASFKVTEALKAKIRLLETPLENISGAMDSPKEQPASSKDRISLDEVLCHIKLECSQALDDLNFLLDWDWENAETFDELELVHELINIWGINDDVRFVFSAPDFIRIITRAVRIKMAEAIGGLRKVAGIKQKAAAKAAGIKNQGTWSKLESVQNNNASLQMMHEILTGFGFRLEIAGTLSVKLKEISDIDRTVCGPVDRYQLAMPVENEQSP